MSLTACQWVYFEGGEKKPSAIDTGRSNPHLGLLVSKGGVVWWSEADGLQAPTTTSPHCSEVFFLSSDKQIACHSSPRLPRLSSSPVVSWTNAAMTVQGWNPVLLVISLWLNFESAGELPPKFRERESFWSGFLFLLNLQCQLHKILYEGGLKYKIICVMLPELIF